MWIPCQRHILSVSCHVKIAGKGAYLHILQKQEMDTVVAFVTLCQMIMDALSLIRDA